MLLQQGDSYGLMIRFYALVIQREIGFLFGRDLYRKEIIAGLTKRQAISIMRCCKFERCAFLRCLKFQMSRAMKNFSSNINASVRVRICGMHYFCHSQF